MANEREVFKKNFPNASIKRMFFGGWRITTRTGFVEYKKKHFTKFVGGPAEYRGVILCLTDFGSSCVTVSGSEKHIVATMAHGLDLGVDVVPEVEDGVPGCLKGCLTLFCWPMVFCVCASVVGLFASDDTVGGWVTFGLTILLMQLWVKPTLKARATRAAQERGQVYRNVLPDVHGDVQHPARIDEIAEDFFRRD